MPGILGSLGPSINNISSQLDGRTSEVLDSASEVQANNEAQTTRLQNMIVANLKEQLNAGDWQVGIKTERKLLSNGVSLAKA